MTKQVQRRRGTSTQHTSFTGAEGEISVNTTNKSVHVHDGVTAGGIEAARADMDNVSSADILAAIGVTASVTELNYVDGVTSNIQTQINAKAPINNATLTGTTTVATADINGGTIDGTVIGATTPAAGTFSAVMVNGNIAVTGTVDGRDVASDGTKLDGIESGADVTDTANVTAAGALMDSELTNITAVKALNQGVATTDSPSFAAVTVDNINLDGNTISSTNTNGDITLDPNGTGNVVVASGNVGIDTSSPSSKLHVNGGDGNNIRYSGATNSVAMGITGVNPFIGSLTSAPLLFLTDATERARIDASGNFGLGVTPSAWSNYKSVQFGYSGALSNHVSLNYLRLESNSFNGGGGETYLQNGHATKYTQNNGAGVHAWYTAPSGTAGNAISFTQAMTLDASGKLLLNTTSATTYQANINGTLGIYGGNGLFLQNGSNNAAAAIYNDGATGISQIQFNAGGTERARIDASGNLLVGTTSGTDTLRINGGIRSLREAFNDGVVSLGPVANSTYLYGSTSVGMSFNVGNTERARIDSSGNLLVGTTSPANGVPSDPVGIHLFGNGSGGSQGAAVFVRNSANHVLFVNNKTSGGGLVMFLNGGNAVGQITSNGSSTTYATSSDYRLKENVAPMQNALDTVARLNPVTYTWKADGSESQGFIAHELQAVVPECVTGEKDAMREEQYEVSPAVPATYDDEGNVLTEAVEAVTETRMVPAYQGIDTSFLVSTLTKAIQEQQAIIADLTARVAALEA